jgi:A/G-specific adenine glycosylase
MPETVGPTDDPARKLLAWYDRHRRTLPWRAAPGAAADPYHVWLSEIMLQQTTVATVGPYFAKFLKRWPEVSALAAAELDDVLHAWAGLGYYARARSLHACARHVHGELDDRFPDAEAALRELPGIGAYTAAAIAAIAFGRRAVVVDGNVERVMARLFAVETPLPAAKPTLRAHADSLTPTARPGDYAQAVMDLGATICAPRRPRCTECPWAGICAARRAGVTENLPRRAPKAERPTRHGVAFWIERADGAVLLRRRPARGLLGAMMEFPSTEWRARKWSAATARKQAPVDAEWTSLPGQVRHGFTHFRLELDVMAGRVDDGDADGVWCPPDRFGDYALPTLMRKVAAHALTALER